MILVKDFFKSGFVFVTGLADIDGAELTHGISRVLQEDGDGSAFGRPIDRIFAIFELVMHVPEGCGNPQLAATIGLTEGVVLRVFKVVAESRSPHLFTAVLLHPDRYKV